MLPRQEFEKMWEGMGGKPGAEGFRSMVYAFLPVMADDEDLNEIVKYRRGLDING